MEADKLRDMILVRAQHHVAAFSHQVAGFLPGGQFSDRRIIRYLVTQAHIVALYQRARINRGQFQQQGFASFTICSLA